MMRWQNRTNCIVLPIRLSDHLKNGATKEMIAAQGLGTVLRLARKLGPVLGKVVAVVGQGQNGLIATRLMSQFAAKAVIAIDPVSFSNADLWHTPSQLFVLYVRSDT